MRDDRWPWWLVLAFVAGLVWANVAQAARGIMYIMKGERP